MPILTSSSYDANADDLIARLGWNKLDVQLKFKTAVMVYKSLNGLVPDYLRTMFSNRSDMCTYSLRGSTGKLTVPLPRTNFLKTVLAIEMQCYGTVYLWQAQSLTSFKSACSGFVFGKNQCKY